MYSRPESGSASRNGSSVVPGLPKRRRTPADRRISIRTAATFMARRILPWRGRRGPELEVLRVYGGADRGQRLALCLHPHHVPRDVEAQGSGRGVAREGDPARRLVLDVAGAVREMAELLAAARARD